MDAIGRIGMWAWFLALVAASTDVGWAARLPVVREFAAPGGTCQGMAMVGGELWVWDVEPVEEDRFYVLDPGNGAVLRSHASPNSNGVSGLAYDGMSLWGVSTTPEPALLARFSPNDGSALGSYGSPVLYPTGIAFDGESLWIAETGTHRIVRVSPTTLAIEQSIVRESFLSYNIAWDGASLWMTAASWSLERGFVSSIQRIDPQAGATLDQYDPPGLSAGGLAFFDGELYVSDVLTDTIYVLAVPESNSAFLVTLIAILIVARTRRSRRPLT